MSVTMPTRYMFVDCPNPQNPKLPRRTAAKSTVRSHLTKEFHRKARVERLAAFKQEQSFANGEAIQARDQLLTRGKTCSDADDATAREIEEVDREQDASKALRRIGDACLATLLSQSRSDPFDCLPIRDMPKYSQRVLDHGEASWYGVRESIAC